LRSTIFRLEIKREDIIGKSRECDKDRSIHNFKGCLYPVKQINLTLLEIKREGDISLHRWRYLCDIVPYMLFLNTAICCTYKQHTLAKSWPTSFIYIFVFIRPFHLKFLTFEIGLHGSVTTFNILSGVNYPITMCLE
jgi:hypothetical protein